jgi:hypothetical protein
MYKIHSSRPICLHKTPVATIVIILGDKRKQQKIKLINLEKKEIFIIPFSDK